MKSILKSNLKSNLKRNLKSIPTTTRQESRFTNTIESQQQRNNTKKNTVKKGKKRVTFWDAPEANKAPYNTENQSNQAPYNSKVIHKLKVMTINTRGIKSKTTSITAALHMNGTHIAAITETLLTGNEDV